VTAASDDARDGRPRRFTLLAEAEAGHGPPALALRAAVEAPGRLGPRVVSGEAGPIPLLPLAGLPRGGRWLGVAAGCRQAAVRRAAGQVPGVVIVPCGARPWRAGPRARGTMQAGGGVRPVTGHLRGRRVRRIREQGARAVNAARLVVGRAGRVARAKGVPSFPGLAGPAAGNERRGLGLAGRAARRRGTARMPVAGCLAELLPATG
jgi:hypothetical protein